ncbi:hypothetical protein Q8A73_013196 [Channa argus]|nr:hypothetical protein Q8A73_013196 [Channa argus]
MTGSRRNAVRFELQSNLEMDRLQFSRNIIQKELGFPPTQLDYIFAFPGKKMFEVVFSTTKLYESCIDTFNRSKDSNSRLMDIRLIPLSEREPKAITVIMYSEKVTTDDIKTWLSFQCTVLRGMELRDEDGIRTGARRFYVQLKRDEDSGQLIHLPSTIQLGSIRGHVFYPGQPKTCRKCGSRTHLAANCDTTYCKNCEGCDHITKDCPQPMKCNLCRSTAHTFRTCPESYANRARKLSLKAQRQGGGGAIGQIFAMETCDQEEVNRLHLPLTSKQLPDLYNQDKFESSGSQSAGDIPRVVDTVGGSQLAVDDMEEAVAQREWGKVSLATSTIAMITADHLSCSSQESLEVLDHCVDTMAVQPTPTPISRLGSTKECRDMLDLMLADLSNLERDTNRDVTIEEGCCPPKDKGLRTPALVSPLTCASSDLLLPRKRSRETSTDSSTNSLDADKWLHLQTNSLPFLDSGGLTSFSEITQMKNKEVEGIQNECCDAWKTQKKKKKKVKISIPGTDVKS